MDWTQTDAAEKFHTNLNAVVQISQKISHELNKAALLCGQANDLNATVLKCNVEGVGLLRSNMLNSLEQIRAEFHGKILCVKFKSLAVEFDEAVQEIMQILLQTIDKKSHGDSAVILRKCGIIWEIQEKLLAAPRDNRQAAIQCVKENSAMIRDAMNELSSILNEDEEDADSDQNRSKFRLKNMEMCLNLIKATVASVSKTQECIDKCPCETWNHNNFLDKICEKVCLLSPCVDDLVCCIHEDVTFTDLKDQSSVLCNRVRELLDELQLYNTQVSMNEDLPKRCDFLRTVLDHNIKKFSCMNLDSRGMEIRGFKFPEFADMLQDQNFIMLVELFDLTKNQDGHPQWNIAARWVKYEEDVEGVDHFWGRPHVSFLNFRALSQLKKLFKNGLVLLELDACSYSSLTSHLVKSLEIQQKMTNAIACKFMQILGEKKVRYADSTLMAKMSTKLSMSKNNSVHDLSMLSPRKSSCASMKTSEHKMSENHHSNNVHQGSDVTTRKPSSIFFSLEAAVPSTLYEEGGADHAPVASQILVGEMDELTENMLILLRFQPPNFLPEITGHSTLLQFLFALMGPPGEMDTRHQVGRAMATLFADKNFHDVISVATSKNAIFDAMDDFMDGSVLIPPGKIDDKSLFTPENLPMQRKQPSQSIRKIDRKISKAKEDVALPLEGGVEQISGVDEEDHFKRTGKPFGGVLKDFRSRFPFYLDDFKKAANFQCVTSILFIFFANFSVAVAIGEVLSERTNGYMGVSEILISHAISGITWALFAGQPLCIVAAVGPFLVFESSLYAFCKSAGINFLAARFWTGVWTFGLTLVMALVEAPSIMRFFSRFSEDIYTLMIAGIFLFEGGKFVHNEFSSHPLQNLDSYCANVIGKNLIESNGTMVTLWNATVKTMKHQKLTNPHIEGVIEQPDTAFLSLILFLATFLLAYGLKRLRTSIYCGRTVRRALGDFGVPLAVFIITLTDFYVFPETYTRHVTISDSFGLTSANQRGWLVNPFGTAAKPLPIWIVPASVVPALLVSIVLFGQVEIVELLLSKKERCLKKPGGFHLDLVIAGVVTLVSSVLGIQWLCPAAVQSMSHAASLTVMKRTAPGEAPKIDFVIEQRVTLLCIALLHGIAAFLGNILIYIPTAALFGLFLYLGVMGLLSTQLWHRVVLYFVPRKYFPNEDYCREVKTWRMHTYTTIQLLCFACLFAVQMFPTPALSFPFVLLVIVAFRKFGVFYMFDERELDALEGKLQKRVNYDEKGHDFYEEINDDIAS